MKKSLWITVPWKQFCTQFAPYSSLVYRLYGIIKLLPQLFIRTLYHTSRENVMTFCFFCTLMGEWFIHLMVKKDNFQLSFLVILKRSSHEDKDPCLVAIFIHSSPCPCGQGNSRQTNSHESCPRHFVLVSAYLRL